MLSDSHLQLLHQVAVVRLLQFCVDVKSTANARVGDDRDKDVWAVDELPSPVALFQHVRRVWGAAGRSWIAGKSWFPQQTEQIWKCPRQLRLTSTFQMLIKGTNFICPTHLCVCRLPTLCPIQHPFKFLGPTWVEEHIDSRKLFVLRRNSFFVCGRGTVPWWRCEVVFNLYFFFFG